MYRSSPHVHFLKVFPWFPLRSGMRNSCIGCSVGNPPSGAPRFPNSSESCVCGEGCPVFPCPCSRLVVGSRRSPGSGVPPEPAAGDGRQGRSSPLPLRSAPGNLRAERGRALSPGSSAAPSDRAVAPALPARGAKRVGNSWL